MKKTVLIVAIACMVLLVFGSLLVASCNDKTEEVETKDTDTKDTDTKDTDTKDTTDDDKEVDTEDEITAVKNAMIKYVEEYGDQSIGDIEIVDIKISADGKTAEATVNATYATGPNAGQEVQPAEIKAEKQNGTWVVTEMGTTGM